MHPMTVARSGALVAALGLSALFSACGSTNDTVWAPGAWGTDASAPMDTASGTDAPSGSETATGTDTPPPPPPPTDDAGRSCVTGTSWTQGNRGSRSMNPGQPCIACHRRMGEEPLMNVGGTLYYDLHERDNCNGWSGNPPGSGVSGVYVELTDANGTVRRITPNTSGNFYANSIPMPLRRARIVGLNGMISEMSDPPPNGDCNSCHSQAGTTTVAGGDNAPGRLTVPL